MKKSIIVLLFLLLIPFVFANTERTIPSTALPSSQITIRYTSSNSVTAITETIPAGFELVTVSDLMNLKDGTLNIFFTGNSQDVVLRVPSTEDTYIISGTAYDIDSVPQTLQAKSIIVGQVSCTPTTWGPNVNTVCAGETFTQTSNCNTTRSAVGTKSCGSTDVTVFCLNSAMTSCTPRVNNCVSGETKYTTNALCNSNIQTSCDASTCGSWSQWSNETCGTRTRTCLDSRCETTENKTCKTPSEQLVPGIPNGILYGFGALLFLVIIMKMI